MREKRRKEQIEREAMERADILGDMLAEWERDLLRGKYRR